MPGYATCFPKLWTSPVGLYLVRKVGLAKDLQKAGLDGLTARLREDRIRCLERTLRQVLTWVNTAAAPDAAGTTHREIALALDDDRQQKEREIQALERRLAGRLARTEYIVLLSIPGINVVSAGEYAGEMGPITRYATPKTITGRAGLYPSRVQSDQVDYADGPLVRCANRQLRFAILQIADCLIKRNKYFATLNHRWKAAGKDPRHTRVRVGSRFARISYHMLAERNVFRHPLARDRSYIVQKLLAFHRAHETPMAQTLADATREERVGRVRVAGRGSLDNDRRTAMNTPFGLPGYDLSRALWQARLLLGFGLLAAPGCVTARHTTNTHIEHGTPIDSTRVDQIVIGEATRADLFKWFGPPQSMFKDDAELVYYERLGFNTYTRNRKLATFDAGHYVLLYLFDETNARTKIKIRAIPFLWKSETDNQASFTGDELLVFLDRDTHVVNDVAWRSTGRDH